MYEQMRPPVNRAMRTLDRSFFHKTVHLSAARVFRNQDIASCRSALSRAGDILKEDRISPVFPDPDPQLAQLGRRVILLQPDILHNGTVPIFCFLQVKSIPDIRLTLQTLSPGAHHCATWCSRISRST